MAKPFLFLNIVALLLIIWPESNCHADRKDRNITKIFWHPIKNADFYMIQIKTQDGHSLRLRSRQESVLFREKIATVSVRAYTNSGYELSSQPDLFRLYLKRHTFNQENTGKDDRTILNTPDSLTREELEEIEAVTRIEKDIMTAFDGPSFRTLMTSFGVGIEQLNATGGSSSFSGNSSITTIGLQLTIDPDQYNDEQRWRSGVRLTMHQFSVEENTASDSEANSFPRHHMSLYGEFLFPWNSRLTLSGRIGLGFQSVITLTRTKSNSSNRELEGRHVNSPTLGMSVSHQIEQTKHLILDLSYSPFSISRQVESFHQFEIYTSYQLHLHKEFHLNPYLMYRDEQTKTQTDCHTSSTSICASKGISNITTFVVGVGAEISF